MEAMPRASYRERARSFILPLGGTPLSPHLHEFTSQKLSEPCPFGVVGRLQYIGMID